MAATFTNATRKFVGQDTFIPEGDIREILAFVKPGEEDNAKAFLRIAGPKGGEFRMFLPDWFYNQCGEEIEPGLGIANGGWQAGRFVVPEFYEAD